MCGFVTIVSSKNDVSENGLKSGLKEIRHRGPDSENTWISRGGNVGLGHVRLSIIDLSTGNQPIFDPKTGNCIVVNGEFYDFEEIRDRLLKQGYTFQTHSDSEIALHLYKHYGTYCLTELRGEFCFSLWDEASQTLFAARDRFGINPLYYTLQGGKLYLASEVKSLFAMGVAAGWDTDSYFSMSFMFQNQTLFNNIHQLPPGHYLLFKEGQLTVSKYWDLHYPNTEDLLKDSEDTMIVTTRHLLMDSVKTRLRADVPVAVYLSGGIDSCGILGMASEINGKPLDSFTLCFDDKEYDEGAIARKMAKQVGSRHHEIHINQDKLADNFFNAVWHTETTCANSHIVAKYLLSKGVQQAGIKVVLTGEGADELFGGYSHFRNDILKYHSDLNPEEIKEQTAKLRDSNQVSAGVFTPRATTSLGLEKDLGMEPTWLLPFSEKYKTICELCVSPSLDAARIDSGIHQNLSCSPIQQFIACLSPLGMEQCEPVSIAQYTISKSILPNYILCNLGDRMEMAHSLEGRVPFLDHHIADYVTKLPAGMKIKGLTEKYVLREALKPFITNEVYQRQKHPFLAPPSVINPKAKFYQLVRDTLLGPLMKDLPFFNHSKIVAFVNESEKAPREQWPFVESILMELLSLCAIQHHFRPSA